MRDVWRYDARTDIYAVTQRDIGGAHDGAERTDDQA